MTPATAMVANNGASRPHYCGPPPTEETGRARGGRQTTKEEEEVAVNLTNDIAKRCKPVGLTKAQRAHESKLISGL
jgi:hypothetical protein